MTASRSRRRGDWDGSVRITEKLAAVVVPWALGALLDEYRDDHGFGISWCTHSLPGTRGDLGAKQELVVISLHR